MGTRRNIYTSYVPVSSLSIQGKKKGSCVELEKEFGSKASAIECHHHVVELHEEAAFRTEFGPTTGPEEDVVKKIKEWHNTTPDKDFQNAKLLPASRSPVLQELRERTVSTLRAAIADEKIRGDYKDLAICTLV